MRTLLMLAILTVPACGQPQGTVNGVPIPSKVFSSGGQRTQAEAAWRLQNKRPIEKDDLPAIERLVQDQRCNKLKGTISSMVQDEVMEGMALTVTPADIAEAQKTVAPFDPKEEVRKRHEYAAAVLAALDAQLNKHEDPQAVYDQYLKPHGITEQAWAYQLLIGQTPEGKQSLMNQMNLTVEAATQAVKNYDWTATAKYRKMNQRIDEQISLSDPKFKQFLAEYSQSIVVDAPGVTHSTGVPADHLAYLENQRKEYWKQVNSKVQVVISEPTMQNCDLSEFGGSSR
jgi:hypothetical protein